MFKALKFSKSISIEGIAHSIKFEFIADNSTNGIIPGYRVHSFDPMIQFHLDNKIIEGVIFQFSDYEKLPKWLKDDDKLLEKLNQAIKERCNN